MVGTSVGYSGGTSEHPTYKTVCAGDGHTEVLAVEYDPARISYERLLDVFFSEHDPTGQAKPQYRSVIFTTTAQQAATAQAVKARVAAARRGGRPIATAIEPARPYWPAEEYHQQYMAKRKRVYGF